jgi:hypothetical protein
MPLKNYEGERGRFLAELLRGESVARAAELAGIPRRTVYDLKDRMPSFAAEWDNAIAESKELLLGKYENELHARALDRDDKYSYLLLMFLIKKLDPAYRDNYKTEHKVVHETVKEYSFSRDDMDKAIEILQSAKETALPSDGSSSE